MRSTFTHLLVNGGLGLEVGGNPPVNYSPNLFLRCFRRAPCKKGETDRIPTVKAYASEESGMQTSDLPQKQDTKG